MKVPHLSAITAILLFFIACEQPNSPNFKVDQQVQLPLLSETTYQFLGSKSALIDSTNAEFDSLFSTKSSGLVNLSKQQDFNFGSLAGAIPVIDVDPKSVEAQVGEIALNDFSSSSGNLGRAGFQQVTGQDPNLFPQGTPIPGGSSTVEIDIETDYLESAVIKGDDGTISISLTNDLGFTIDQMTVYLTSENRTTPYGSDQIPTGANFLDNETRTFEISFSDGDVLQNLKAEIEVSWNSQQTSDDPNDLVVSELQAENMAASQVTAAIESQDFSTRGNVNIDNNSFQFNKPEHYLEIASGNLLVGQITNGIDLGIDPLVISFPGIRSAPYNPEDSLVIRFEGNSKIPRSQSSEQPPSKSIDLSSLRLYATSNQLEYNIQGTTENTQDGNASERTRTISENDQMSATVEISGLEIEEAFGVLTPKSVIVNNDDPINGFNVVDLFRESEVEIITIDALSDLSERLKGIELNDPALSIGYLTNIGVSATIYAGILGVDGSGNQVFLKGLDTQGNPHRVDPANAPTELAANGTTLTPDQLIKFQIDPASGGTISDAIQFDRSQTNVDEFLNNLPSHIRFVSVAVVNEEGQEGTITDPVQFDPSMSVDIPLNFTANNASFTDTLETDLSNLPDSRADNQRVTQTEIHVEYTNGLPLGVSLNLAFLDENGDKITEISSNPNSAMHIKAAKVEQAGYASQTNTGNLTIALNEEQLEQINETDNMQFRLQLNSTNSSAVKVRATDTISFKISLSAAVESTVN